MIRIFFSSKFCLLKLCISYIFRGIDFYGVLNNILENITFSYTSRLLYFRYYRTSLPSQGLLHCFRDLPNFFGLQANFHAEVFIQFADILIIR